MKSTGQDVRSMCESAGSQLIPTTTQEEAVELEVFPLKEEDPMSGACPVQGTEDITRPVRGTAANSTTKVCVNTHSGLQAVKVSQAALLGAVRVR